MIVEDRSNANKADFGKWVNLNRYILGGIYYNFI
jgi:hypothetical protein